MGQSEERGEVGSGGIVGYSYTLGSTPFKASECGEEPSNAHITPTEGQNGEFAAGLANNVFFKVGGRTQGGRHYNSESREHIFELLTNSTIHSLAWTTYQTPPTHFPNNGNLVPTSKVSQE